MEGPRDYHTQWSKPDKDKCHMILLIWGNKQTNKKDTNELVYEREIDPQT